MGAALEVPENNGQNRQDARADDGHDAHQEDEGEWDRAIL